ncbi:hypothetical protein ONE63_001674 [Megalurothrips usitatus]|uniref:Peptidase M13 N-terminal domain-containing protein n=1 Tax=Megalurothrips usitatus TaxID=439358 RepID=A0AAV7XA00_9NEOP|nr:hypothetical protein ONE63_001674 [Megalurothrips usitatus]
MNVSADPCSDFYAFACGSGRVQGFNNQDDPQTAKRDVVKKQLITILSEPVTNETVLAYTKAKKLYKSCADTKHREQLGVEPAKKLLTSIGGWPLIDGVNACNSSRKCDLSELVVKVIDVGLISNHLVDVTVLPGISGSNKWTLHASRPSFNVGTPLAELLKNTFIPDYREKLKASAELLADNQKPISRTLDYEVAQIVDFEVTLNNISKNENPSKNFTVSELLSRFSFLPWMAIYNRYLLKGLSDYDVVTVDDPNYLDDVKEILKSTPNRTVINYVVGRSVLEGMLPFLNSEARILAEPYGLKNKSIEERCLGFVHESFPLLTTSMYVRQHIRKEVRDKVVEVVVNIIAEMKHILQNEAWLDEGSRRAFNTKLEKMTYIVGYPDELLNTALLNSHFGNVQISDDSLLENSISISKRMYSRMFAKFNTSVEKLDWDFPITWAPFEPESLLNAQYIHLNVSSHLAAMDITDKVSSQQSVMNSSQRAVKNALQLTWGYITARV